MTKVFWQTALFGAAVTTSFVAINFVTGSPLLLQLKQGWDSHFSGLKISTFVVPEKFRFDWAVLAKNWDLTLPAIAGVCVLGFAFYKLLRSRPAAGPGIETNRARAIIPEPPATRSSLAISLPLAWIGLTLIVFPTHRPWWAYYYVHNVLPLCWAAGIGIVTIVPWATIPRATTGKIRTAVKSMPPSLARLAFPAAFLVCSVGWTCGRVYLEAAGIRAAPRVNRSLVLKEILRFKPLTKFVFTDQAVYSFHADIPLPPHLAMLSLKRMWTGEMTPERLASELAEIKPGIILWANDGDQLPFQQLLADEYRLVYEDSANRLFAHRSIASAAKY